MQTIGSYSNPEYYAEISGNDLNGKAFSLQEDMGKIMKKKLQTQDTITRKELTKKGSKE